MDCWASFNGSFDGSGGNTTILNTSNSYYKFITTNGMVYAIIPYTTCNTNLSNNTTMHMRQICGQLLVDINGPKKGPNYNGRDIFVFYITNGKGALLYPYGGSDALLGLSWHKGTPQKTDDWCSPKSENIASTGRDGATCTARIMEKSWQIDYLD
ncbi:MAG: hypothetical protein MZV64_27410 [Ignavibacteriales bacterium]|nr:hypothetical protein [Ignavibacteriales bacterium]